MIATLRQSRDGNNGFSLVEVVMALGIFAFVGAALIGLFVIGVDANRESMEKLEATNLIQSWIAARRAAPTAAMEDRCPIPPLNSVTEKLVSIPIPISASGQKVSSPAEARFGLIFRITPPISPTDATKLHVALYWPANGSPSQAIGYQEMSSSFLLQ